MTMGSDAESGGLRNGKSDIQSKDHLDAGALFVLESKGNWLHAGYHLTTSIVAPSLLSLPFAFTSLGWFAGIFCLIVGAAVTFYSYNLISIVLERQESQGNRHLRFRDMARDILGPRWARLAVAPMQFAVCLGSVIGSILFGGQSLKFIYLIYHPNGDMKLYEFIILFGIVMLFLSQMPSFHSLRHMNLLSLIMGLLYSLCVVGGSIHAGHSKLNPEKDYSDTGSDASKVFKVFNSIAMIATIYGNGIIPEIQATLAPPVSGKMFKGLCICYTVVVSTFFSVAVSGYWAFGNQAAGNIFSNFAPTGERSLIPNWLLFIANMCVIVQLFAFVLVYSQPTFEVLEAKSGDASNGRFSLRNLLPRLLLRSLYVSVATLIAAMLPFCQDVIAVIGAFGFLPLDFVFPVAFYNITFKPSKRSLIFWINTLIAVVFSILGVLGCIAAIRQVYVAAHDYKLFANL
eukprot:PITA_00834